MDFLFRSLFIYLSQFHIVVSKDAFSSNYCRDFRVVITVPCTEVNEISLTQKDAYRPF